MNSSESCLINNMLLDTMHTNMHSRPLHWEGLIQAKGYIPARAEIWNEISALCTPHAPPIRPQHRVPEKIPSLETHHQQVKGRSNGCRYISR